MKVTKKLKKLLESISLQTKLTIGFIALLLLLFNAFVWIGAILSIPHYPFFIGLVAIAYGLGLRHAVDPDHIAAIDNTTRKLIHDGKKPIATGLFFSLGHSTIVVLLSLLIIFSSTFIQHNLPSFKQTGSIIGTIISGLFLFLVGLINTLILINLFKVLQHTKKGELYTDISINKYLDNRGLLARILKPLLKTVSNSWNMYPVGLLFGLGFDTASEVALLSLSATTSIRDIPYFIILLLPLSFTAGMTLIDTLDGIVMLGAYGWAYINPRRKLYYNIIIVFLSVAVAFFVGGIEMIQIISNQTGFLSIINQIKLDNFGFFIITAFILCWGVTFLITKMKKDYEKSSKSI